MQLLGSIKALSGLEFVSAYISINGCPELFDFSPLYKVFSLCPSLYFWPEVSGCGYNPTKEQILNGEGNG